MELTIPLIAVPAIIALLFKAGIFAYAQRSTLRNAQTRIYLLFLFALSIQNLAEIFGFYKLNVAGIIPTFEASLFYGSSILVLALLLQLSMSMAIDELKGAGRYVLIVVYSYAAVLLGLLFFTPLLIAKFEIFQYSFGQSMTRVAGPLFPMFEIFALVMLAGSIGTLLWASAKQTNAAKRARSTILLAAIIPMVIVVPAVIALLHFGIRWINASVTFPLCVTYFLIVTAYATHQHRIFDIQFFIPWSKVRERKTAFYGRIRTMIAEIADLGSGTVNTALERLSDTLRCPAAFVDDSRLVIASAGGSQIKRLPLETLRSVEHITVANEIADSNPALYRMMQQNGVAAVVPFYPHSKNAASWLLLGDSFSENVYTPLDFRMVEQLFDRMAELFLDKLVQMRVQLTEAQTQVVNLTAQLEVAETSLSAAYKKVEMLAFENTRLLREQPADSLAVAQRTPRPFMLTLLGRDKEMLRRLRTNFPQAEQYAGVESSSFRRQPIPDVLLVHVPQDTATNERKLLQALNSSHRRCALLFYGERAAGFVSESRDALLGNLAELLPEHFTDEILARKIKALAELRNTIHDMSNPYYPLLGQCVVMTETLTNAKRLAGLKEPIFIKGEDIQETSALANFIHATSGVAGAFVIVKSPADAEAACAQARDGTLVIDNLDGMSSAAWETLLVKSNSFSNCRLIVCGALTDESTEVAMRLHALKPFTVVVPTLRQRRADIGLLVHYFTLQFNLQSGAARYLTPSEVDALLSESYPKNLAALKAAVFERLIAKERKLVAEPEMEINSNGRTLEECVSEFEARLIADTLKRCGGNKSKAARMLGMRPNTLHYKMERYGLLD